LIVSKMKGTNVKKKKVIMINYICCKMENDMSYTRQFILSAETYEDNIEIIRTIVHREYEVNLAYNFRQVE